MKRLKIALICVSTVLLTANLAGCENTQVSGSVSYGVGYGAGYGYPMYYGAGYPHYNNVTVVRPPVHSRPRPQPRPQPRRR
ncbi:hypothetical protein NQT69_10740 [Pseudoalteromonas shioyasakiensis]|uniref:hypothetical protein n=1 Tax=Pseudoalteromonas shioyasakiensis TaxID=1190813 RepID=UPI00211817CC|nr:hypothetical protein [Pseudoalteromonas shioyasakiensis]MCQ8878477.1 hypothetical protein [Pseudoalteromonas shioyasakiensis]